MFSVNSRLSQKKKQQTRLPDFSLGLCRFSRLSNLNLSYIDIFRMWYYYPIVSAYGYLLLSYTYFLNYLFKENVLYVKANLYLFFQLSTIQEAILTLCQPLPSSLDAKATHIQSMCLFIGLELVLELFCQFFFFTILKFKTL